MAKAKSTEQPAQSNNIKWTLVKRQLSELKPYPKNPRTITEQGLKDLKKSVDKFGLAEPIIINTDNIIIGGHARYLTLKNNNAVECDCYLPSRKLNAKEVEELNIRLNKNIAGVFDFDILANEFELDLLLDVGFEKFELGVADEVSFPALKDGDKEPFQQMTFTLADEQAKLIQNALTEMKKTDTYKYGETLGNENSNGNALYFIVSEWVGQRI